jgi:hypothetical protein
MNPNKLVEHNALADQAALKADQAIRATQRVANETLDSLTPIRSWTPTSASPRY